MYFYNSAGPQIASSTNGTGALDSASVANNATAAATICVRVVHYSGGTGATGGKYSLKLSW